MADPMTQSAQISSSQGLVDGQNSTVASKDSKFSGKRNCATVILNVNIDTERASFRLDCSVLLMPIWTTMVCAFELAVRCSKMSACRRVHLFYFTAQGYRAYNLHFSE